MRVHVCVQLQPACKYTNHADECKTCVFMVRAQALVASVYTSVMTVSARLG